ncbi:MAG: aldo/keto reductase [Proteobacteria bacterium]|nr:aldo/keto reductase [Pseudomonadota bacterium]
MERITVQGMRMPKLGLGTGQLRNAEGQASMELALSMGFRHLDTAEMYTNEATVGAAVAASGLPRGEIHITSKVHQDNLAPDALRRAMDRCLAALKSDYVDLYLIHWPMPEMNLAKTLETLVRLKEQGKARAIGVSNFTVALMREAVEKIGAPIACNQVEYHVLLDQSAVLDYARSKGIAVTAYAPLARGRINEFPELARIGRKHGASPVQVALKWLLDQDLVAAIPRTGRRETLQQNLDAVRLKLDNDDRAAIARLPKNQRIVNVAWAPAWDKPRA